MAEKLVFLIHQCLYMYDRLSGIISLYTDLFYLLLYKMMDNKTKTSFNNYSFEKTITHRELQYNTHARHSFIIFIFIRDVFLMSFKTFTHYTFLY